MRALATAILLGCGVAQAATPFSSNFDYPVDTVTVPDGMVWVVDFISGFAELPDTQLPSVLQVTGETVVPGYDPGSLFILPTSSVQDVDVNGRVIETLYSFNGPASHRFFGEVNSTLASFGGEVTFSLSGYLTPLLPGDFNGDGVVEAADYTLARDELGQTTSQADLDTWAANYGASDSSAAAVPEPAAWVMSLVAITASTRRRRQRGRLS